MIAGTQVLICPECQTSHDWQADLDRCAQCGASTLVRSLGETRCKSCGTSFAGDTDAPPADPSLAADVAAALERRFD